MEGTSPQRQAGSDLAKLIDHTVLRPEATWQDIQKACQEAVEFRFFGLCIDRKWLQQAREITQSSGVRLVTVVGFPSGAEPTSVKVVQTQEAIRQGADEVDMVMNRHFLHQKQYQQVVQDIQAVVQAAEGKLVKVILETSELTDEEKSIACALSVIAGAKFVKTSTGFSSGGATVNDVLLMRRCVGPSIGVKASGGIRDQKSALDMVKAGASRLGTSASVTIVQGASAGGAGY